MIPREALAPYVPEQHPYATSRRKGAATFTSRVVLARSVWLGNPDLRMNADRFPFNTPCPDRQRLAAEPGKVVAGRQQMRVRCANIRSISVYDLPEADSFCDRKLRAAGFTSENFAAQWNHPGRKDGTSVRLFELGCPFAGNIGRVATVVGGVPVRLGVIQPS